MSEQQQARRLSRAQVADLHGSRPARTYQKRGTFIARYAEPGETILTIVAGRLETLAGAEWGDVVLMNIEVGSSVERYLIKPAMFDKRYDRTDRTIVTDGHSWMVVKAKGRVDAFRYEGPSIVFEAPWGEDMILQDGDWLARPTEGAADDIYRIEREAFAQTYSEEVAAQAVPPT
jgi:hypothetical protein